jgi:hypothetical protein
MKKIKVLAVFAAALFALALQANADDYPAR